MASLESCRIPKTNFLVDLFRRPPKGDWIFFLSHFHSDHYGGITKKWKNGPIYCSKITSNFLKRRIEVSEKYVFDLELNKKIVFGEYTVTLIDANHCFGAVMFVFEETPPGSKIYIHTGDFRFHEKMVVTHSFSTLLIIMLNSPPEKMLFKIFFLSFTRQ
eukprot:GHVL01044947.1.p1 GENE.GHVL01044947.1~~GHVL01044947.1.p1  ORF type:complete len:160 (-),score=20.43 GHVL01044947.1:180-659(-)